MRKMITYNLELTTCSKITKYTMACLSLMVFFLISGKSIGAPANDFDCLDLQANIGDACNDGNDNTTNDVIIEDCTCAGIPFVAPACEDFAYYLSDHSAENGISDIYAVTLSGGVATLTYLATSDIEVHIAYNAVDNLIYAVSKYENSYRTLDPHDVAPYFEPAVDLGGDYGEITAAVFNADGKLLIGSQTQKAIYSVNVASNVVSVYDTYAPISGGDLAFASNGMLYLATRSGNGLYEVYPEDVIPDILIGSVTSKVTGLAITNSDQLLLSNQGNASLEVRNLDGTNPGTTFVLTLDGEPYTLRDGDLTGGCISGQGLSTECYGFEVLEFVQGLQTNGSPIVADRSDASAALGQPDASNATGGFVSLGVGGSITIGFGGAVYDEPGNDIRIWETSYSGDVCGSGDDEFAEIELSQDGINFAYVGTICRDGEVDIAVTGLEYVSVIRITNSALTGTPDGYDVDGVEAIHGCSPTPLIEEGNCYATEVVEYVQGTAFNGSGIAPNRTDASQALGTPERVDQVVFVSLGYGGSLTLAFDGAIPNGPGNDIEVVETTFGNMSCESYAEYADVHVSVDGVNFFFAKTVCRADGFVDISDAGAFAYVNYVKIVNNNDLSTTPDAFDVDGVVALHNCEEEEEEDSPRPSLDPQNQLTSYPNPTAGLSEVVFVASEPGHTLVEVYDMSGRNVATLFNAEAQSSVAYTLNFDGSALPNGVYIYRMTTKNESIIEKFMIAK